MIQKTIEDMTPFLFFFNGQILFLAAVFTLTDNQEESFLSFIIDDVDEYEHRGVFAKSYLKTVDFT